MKKIAPILLALLLIVFGFSCSGLIPGSKTSLVTITVGSDHTASIKAEPAALAARITRFLARSFHMSSAVAAIPAVVVSMRVTVSAPDMQTITVNELVAGQTSIAFLLEIPNGNARNFLLEGRDASNNVAYWNEFSLDLSGGLINQAVDMLFVGSVQNYLYVDVSGSDTNTGTKSSPLRTITRALTMAGPGTSIFIEPGTYVTGETFPLVMKVNTALVGLGPNYTTMIDNSASVSSTITGTMGAVLNGCRINVAQSPTPIGITDNFTAMTIISSLVSGGTSTAASASTCIALTGSTRVAKSTITGCSFGGNGVGISIGGGSPIIELNTIMGNQGRGISISAGNPVIQNNDIQTNTTGISIANVSPLVTNNTVHGNTTGILVTSSTALPLINNNSIYCNTAVDLNASGTIAPINATLNSWDHDLLTTPTGPTVGIAGCAPGTDICPGTAFTYTPFNTAVPGGCL